MCFRSGPGISNAGRQFSRTDILAHTASCRVSRRCGRYFQEVFIRVFRHLKQFREESSLATWIYKIATNESLRFLKSRKAEVVSAEEIQEELLDKLKTSDYVDYDNELAVKFQTAVLKLPEKQRIVFNLRYYDELDYEAISQITGDRVETLKVNYHYAKEKIKEYIVNN